MKAERSVDSSFISAKYSSSDQVFGDRDCTVDYNDCIKILSDAEISQVRNAMHDHGKERLATMAKRVSHQMEAFHELLEENHSLKQVMTRVKERMKTECLIWRRP